MEKLQPAISSPQAGVRKLSGKPAIQLRDLFHVTYDFRSSNAATLKAGLLEHELSRRVAKTENVIAKRTSAENDGFQGTCFDFNADLL